MKIQLQLIVLLACASCKPSAPEGTNTGTLPAPLAQSAPIAQCGKDTDCKGERICDQNVCVEPSQVATSDTASTEEHLVFNEPLDDIYSNNWYAYPLDDDFSDGRTFFVTRDGKDAELTVRLTINCADKKPYWQWGLQYGSIVVDDASIEDSVPKEVLANISKKYCK